MKALFVSNMYPSEQHPTSGRFIAREVAALSALRPDIDIAVIAVDTVARTSRYLTGSKTVARACAEFAPDLVHVHYGLAQALTVLWRGPRVITFHGSDLAVPWQRAVSAALLRPDDGIIVVNAQMLEALPGRSARVIPCGVDTVTFHPRNREAARERMGLGHGALVLGFPSSPSRAVKDYPLFLAVAAWLRQQGHQVEVVLFDALDGRRLTDAMAALDCMVMTSLREGSPVITQEALCCGTRVVSVDVGDVRRQVMGLQGCRIVPSRDAELLGRAVLTSMAEGRPNHAEAGRRFSIVREAAAVAAVYDSVLRSR